MLFFHGWPDTSALFANQFAAFCGDEGEFSCVAPSMMNYNPDVDPVYDQDKLSWPVQADVLHEVVTDMGLEDITLVIHDFGSIVGFQYTVRYPETVKRVVAMDIGNNVEGVMAPSQNASLFSFQLQAISAYLSQNSTAMNEVIQSLAPPCADCQIAPDTDNGVEYLLGWMHYNFINEDPAWTSFFDEPEANFNFQVTPSWPEEVPQLFLYGTLLFVQDSLLTWLDERGDGSGHQQIGTDHWFMARTTANETNQAMAAFFEATSDSDTTTAASESDSDTNAPTAAPASTVLNDQFCQVYYSLDDGNCETLRDSVRSEIRGNNTPTLELGYPSEKPVMLFFHGWPDTSALFANQFAAFCGDEGEFSCVAPSMMNYNPDVDPVYDQDKLSWPVQADVLHEVVTDMGLEDITLVIHDFGSIVGFQYTVRYPETVKRVVAMDIGNNVEGVMAPSQNASLFSFQLQAISAYLSQNSTAMNEVIQSLAPPCADCQIAPDTDNGVEYLLGWMHYNFINEDPAWTSFFDEPEANFNFQVTPSWPEEVPQLFLYGTLLFVQDSLLTWLDERGDGSGHQQIGTDHWFMARTTANETNQAMAAFFEATSDSGSSSRAARLLDAAILTKVGFALFTARHFNLS